MASLHSFYLEASAWKPPFILREGEAHHLSRVLRIKVGTRVRLFDGQGRHGLFEVTGVGKSGVALHPLSEEFTPPPQVRCTLAAGFSKALRRGWFLEKAVELEAAALWFWQGEYSQMPLPETEKSAWKAALVAGAKQCEGTWLPELAMIPKGAEGIAGQRPLFDRAFLLYEGETGGRLLEKNDVSAPGSMLLVVGPEGGFSPREVRVLTGAGVIPVSLGSRVLRWETAAVLTLGLAWWARQGL